MLLWIKDTGLHCLKAKFCFFETVFNLHNRYFSLLKRNLSSRVLLPDFITVVFHWNVLKLKKPPINFTSSILEFLFLFFFRIRQQECISRKGYGCFEVLLMHGICKVVLRGRKDYVCMQIQDFYPPLIHVTC